MIAIGDRQFAAEIHGLSDEARTDWRADYASHRYERAKVPPDVADGVRALMQHFGLTFAALDFVVHDGQWTFLEINPNGQWAWLAQELRLPISSALASHLAGVEA